jgi:hypothetical protein
LEHRRREKHAGYAPRMKVIASLWPVALVMRCKVVVEGMMAPFSRRPFNVAQLFVRVVEGIREGKPVSPDFDVVVQRHQLLDAIQKASDTGLRQIL